MPFPQCNIAVDVPFGTVTAQVASGYAANNGDIVVYTPTAAASMTLPVVSSVDSGGVLRGNHGPVTVINLAAFAITVKPAAADQASRTIQGAAGATGYVIPAGGTGATATKATFVVGSDGNWYAAA